MIPTGNFWKLTKMGCFRLCGRMGFYAVVFFHMAFYIDMMKF